MNTRQAIIDKVNEVVALARVKFPAYVHPTPTIHFYTTGSTAGKAGSYKVLKFNLTVFEQDMPRFLSTTVAHEIAHIVCFALGIDRGHGVTWKRVCLALGGNGQRCYSSDGLELKTRGKRYEHKATCGTVMLCGAVVHNRIMSGAVYTLKASKGKLNATTFTGICK
jgi:predicted SprT family Zn-dependent metalloprotease